MFHENKGIISLLLCLVLAAGLLSLTACGGGDQPAAAADGKLVVAVSIVPERTFVEPSAATTSTWSR
jgi:ABC-type oligopeptide transport system substrate-binding subunit